MTILIYLLETWSCCSTSLTLTLGKLFQLRRQISVRNSSDFLTLRLREQKIMVLLKLMCLKLNTTTSCIRSKAEENTNGQLVEADLILNKLGPFSENFGQNMSYDTNGSLDRALELAKKRWLFILIWVEQALKIQIQGDAVLEHWQRDRKRE